MDDQAAYKRAEKRVAAKISLYIHLAAYIAVNLLLIVINLFTSTDYLWFKWPLLGWGIGVGAHALIVFALPKGAPLKERMIQRELARQQGNA